MVKRCSSFAQRLWYRRRTVSFFRTAPSRSTTLTFPLLLGGVAPAPPETSRDSVPITAESSSGDRHSVPIIPRPRRDGAAESSSGDRHPVETGPSARVSPLLFSLARPAGALRSVGL